VVLLHLAFWSQLGVLTRIYLDALFTNGCTGSFGICLTSAGTYSRSPTLPRCLCCLGCTPAVLSVAVEHSVLCAGAKRNSLGAYFTDLPPNMLGSFVMGLLAASSTLGLSTNKALAILPAHHSWQVRLARLRPWHACTLARLGRREVPAHRRERWSAARPEALQVCALRRRGQSCR